MRQRLSAFFDLAARLSIRSRLTLLATAAAAVVLTISSLLLYDGLYSAIDDAVTAELRIRSDDVIAELRADAEPPLVGGMITQVLTHDGEVLTPRGASSILSAGELPTARGTSIIERPVDGVGNSARILIQSVELPGGEERVIVVAGSTAPIIEAQRRLAVVLGIAGPVMMLGVAATAWILTTVALRPVAHMSQRADTLSLSDPNARLPQPPGRDEIAQLGTTLNSMLARIASTVAHERAFIDDASHELRTPLAVLRSELELARFEIGTKDTADQTAAALDSALEETDRLITLAERLLVLARADAGGLVGPPEAVGVIDVVSRVIDRLAVATPAIETHITANVVWCDPFGFEQIISNLLDNAVHWAATRVRLDATATTHGITITVADDGPGFAPDVLDRAFDRFSRASASRERSAGAGLGLAIVAEITAALGGQIDAANGPPLGGARVTVTFPAR